MRLAHQAALALAAFLAGTSAALAESPVGQWNVVFFDEPGLNQDGSANVCFKADHTWYSPGSPAYKGSWFGEGDELRWYGTGFTAIANHDRFISKTLMSGVFDEFKLSNGQTRTPPANTILERAKVTCDPLPSASSSARGTFR